MLSIRMLTVLRTVDGHDDDDDDDDDDEGDGDGDCGVHPDRAGGGHLGRPSTLHLDGSRPRTLQARVRSECVLMTAD